MAQTTPYPPSFLQPQQSIPPELALEKIQTYLSLASTHAYLHPSVTLSERGPVANLASASGKGGIVLHNLRRIEASLRGERWGEDPPIEEDEVADEEEAGQPKQKKRKGRTEEAEAVKEEGEDPEEYQLHQEVLEGHVGKRNFGVVEKVPFEVQSGPVDGGGGKISKEERKRLKKERQAQEKMERAAKRQEGKK